MPKCVSAPLASSRRSPDP